MITTLLYMGYVLDRDFVAHTGGTDWYISNPPSEAAIAAAELPAAQDARIKQINAECRSRLFARFGEPAEQVSRSLGVYGATEKAALTDGLASTIDASNEASNAVLAATTIPDVEAVTVTWPVS